MRFDGWEKYNGIEKTVQILEYICSVLVPLIALVGMYVGESISDILILVWGPLMVAFFLMDAWLGKRHGRKWEISLTFAIGFSVVVCAGEIIKNI